MFTSNDISMIFSNQIFIYQMKSLLFPFFIPVFLCSLHLHHSHSVEINIWPHIVLWLNLFYVFNLHIMYSLSFKEFVLFSMHGIFLTYVSRIGRKQFVTYFLSYSLHVNTAVSVSYQNCLIIVGLACKVH